MIDLSILVCSIDTRKHYLRRLLDVLEPQLNDRVELKIACDDGDVPIGKKRNDLVKEARGRWICAVDDDDYVVPDYVKSIQCALDLDPDVVGFNTQVNIDGRFDCMAYITMRNPGYTTERVGRAKQHIRTPNHLCPIRSKFVKATRFPEINHGEDTEFAMRVRKLLTSEVYIDRTLYVYDYRTESHRVGEKTHAKLKKR